MDKPLLGTWDLTGVDETISKYNTTGRIGMHFRADLGGVLSVSKAECVIESMEMVEVEVPVNSSNGSSTQGIGTSSASEASSTLTNSSEAASDAGEGSEDAVSEDEVSDSTTDEQQDDGMVS